MAVASPYSSKSDETLMTELWDPQIADDLEKFVLYAIPWGKPGTKLEKFKGPRNWQRDELQAITEHIKNQKLRADLGLEPQVYMSATASGRGVGKSALVAWLNLWMMSTRLGSTSINTANTESQLKTKTWAELGNWHTLCINSHWFERSALSLKPAPWFEKALKDQLKIDSGYYYSQALLWSEDNPDAFAGTHNHNGLLLIFDEASGIPKPIWTVSEGFFTEPIVDRYWFCFSNPRRNTGEFFECFHKNRDYWKRRNLDSRKVEGTDSGLLQQIVARHGDDSDEARVEVKGEFPRQGDKQFISREFVEDATQRELVPDDHAPLILGVDIARFGNDKTVLRWRQGRDARSIPPVVVKGMDNMQVAGLVAHWINKTNPDGVFIDAGNGTGVIDRLKELGYKVHEVWFGTKSSQEEWANKRTEMWAKMREWLRGGCIDDSQELKDDLTGPEYKFMGSSDKMMLESKEEMKKRGLASPDHGDALAVTFAGRVARKDLASSRVNRRGSGMVRDSDYAFFG